MKKVKEKWAVGRRQGESSKELMEIKGWEGVRN